MAQKIAFNATLKNLRMAKGVTQKQAAEALGMGVGSYNAIENITQELVSKLAKYYGTDAQTVRENLVV